MPLSLKEAVEAVAVIPFERLQQRTSEQIEDVPLSLEEIVEVDWSVPHIRVQQQGRIAAQRVNIPVPPRVEEIAEVLRDQIVAQRVEIPELPVVEEIATVDIPVPQVVE